MLYIAWLAEYGYRGGYGCGCKYDATEGVAVMLVPAKVGKIKTTGGDEGVEMALAAVVVLLFGTLQHQPRARNKQRNNNNNETSNETTTTTTTTGNRTQQQQETGNNNNETSEGDKRQSNNQTTKARNQNSTILEPTKSLTHFNQKKLTLTITSPV